MQNTQQKNNQNNMSTKNIAKELYQLDTRFNRINKAMTEAGVSAEAVDQIEKILHEEKKAQSVNIIKQQFEEKKAAEVVEK